MKHQEYTINGCQTSLLLKGLLSPSGFSFFILLLTIFLSCHELSIFYPEPNQKNNCIFDIDSSVDVCCPYMERSGEMIPPSIQTVPASSNLGLSDCRYYLPRIQVHKTTLGLKLLLYRTVLEPWSKKSLHLLWAPLISMTTQLFTGQSLSQVSFP